MEKMDSEKKREHVKCYSNTLLAVVPSQKRWICELCGEEGTEVVGTHGVVIGRYEQLKGKKDKGEFRRPTESYTLHTQSNQIQSSLSRGLR